MFDSEHVQKRIDHRINLEKRKNRVDERFTVAESQKELRRT